MYVYVCENWCVSLCIDFLFFFLYLLQNLQVAKLLTLAWVKRCIFFVKDTENQSVNPLLKILCTVSNMMPSNIFVACFH